MTHIIDSLKNTISIFIIIYNHCIKNYIFKLFLFFYISNFLIVDWSMFMILLKLSNLTNPTETLLICLPDYIIPEITRIQLFLFITVI